MPASTLDPRWLILARAQRGFIDGVVSITLARHLTGLGFGPSRIGSIATGTLLGSAVLTIVVGLYAHRADLKKLLLGAAVLMVATGIGFASLHEFWTLLAVAVLGTLNPSNGDVSVFLPLEQAALAGTAEPGAHTARMFARYNVLGAAAGALGALAAGLPWLASGRTVFLLYAFVGVMVGVIYLQLPHQAAARTSVPLARSRKVVFRLAALFSLDSFGGGFVVQSLLALWLFRRFDLSVAKAGTVFFVLNLLSALSQFLSPRLAGKLGLVRTMVYTHLPASLFLIIAGTMPTLELALTFLILRACVSSMDIPARQAYVMAVVPPEERPAAASFTNVPRSLAAAIPPMLTGLILQRTTYGWPLILAGSMKAAYDLLLLAQFRSVPERVAE